MTNQPHICAQCGSQVSESKLYTFAKGRRCDRRVHQPLYPQHQGPFGAGGAADHEQFFLSYQAQLFSNLSSAHPAFQHFFHFRQQLLHFLISFWHRKVPPSCSFFLYKGGLCLLSVFTGLVHGILSGPFHGGFAGNGGSHFTAVR